MPNTPNPIEVMPRFDVPSLAYHLCDEEALAAAGAALSLNVLHTTKSFLDIPMERRYSLASAAHVDEWIIKHPNNGRDLEVVPGWKFEKAFLQIAELPDPASADIPDLEIAVRAEAPEGAIAAAVLYDSPEGVLAFPVYGIVSASHIIGLATVTAGRIGGHA